MSLAIHQWTLPWSRWVAKPLGPHLCPSPPAPKDDSFSLKEFKIPDSLGYKQSNPLALQGKTDAVEGDCDAAHVSSAG